MLVMASERGQAKALTRGRTRQTRIERCELEIELDASHVESGGELNGIIASKGMTLGQRACSADDGIAHLDDRIRAPLRVELSHDPA